MGIKIYQNARNIERNSMRLDKPVRLFFKQYYQRSNHISWYSFGRDSLESMLRYISNAKKTETFRHVDGVLRKVNLSEIERDILDVKIHMSQEAAEQIVKYSNPASAFTVSVERYGVSKEFEVTSLNPKIILQVLFETHPELRSENEHEAGSP